MSFTQFGPTLTKALSCSWISSIKTNFSASTLTFPVVLRILFLFRAHCGRWQDTPTDNKSRMMQHPTGCRMSQQSLCHVLNLKFITFCLELTQQVSTTASTTPLLRWNYTNFPSQPIIIINEADEFDAPSYVDLLEQMNKLVSLTKIGFNYEVLGVPNNFGILPFNRYKLVKKTFSE